MGLMERVRGLKDSWSQGVILEFQYSEMSGIPVLYN